MNNLALVTSYLVAAVVANLAANHFGQVALPWVAFFIIPFDLCARDVLHDRWLGSDLWLRMAVLVMGGSLLTTFVNFGAWRVAVASALAFLAAGIADTVAYWLLRRHGRLARMNGSNAISAVVDSVVFPTVAFGGLSWALSGAQAVAKFAGGIVWSLLFVYLILRRKYEDYTQA